MSTAMIRAAPDTMAASREFSPTPPRPTTATVAPGGTLAVLMTAPAPVITPQPNSAASSIEISSPIGMTALRGTTAYSAKQETQL